jgi:inosose dehydratase
VLERSNNSDQGDAGSPLVRLAGAPISWGVCEVPGWGRMLPPDVVLGEMRSLGITATELGPEGWLPTDHGRLKELLDGYGLRLVGGFVPLVLHNGNAADATREAAVQVARLLAATGGEVLVSAAVASPGWASHGPLAAGEWKHMAGMLAALEEIAGEHGLVHALHPHIGTVVETAADVERLTEESNVQWCLDTGHLAIMGVDPLALVTEVGGRIAHVHLKDVDLALAAGVRSGTVTLREATRQGLFRPLGGGDVPVDEVVGELVGSMYAGWYVIEQDVVLAEPGSADESPARSVQASIEYLRGLGAGLLAEGAQHGKRGALSQDAGREHEEVT